MNLYNFTPPSVDWLMLAPAGMVFWTGVVAFLMMMFQKRKNNAAVVIVSGVGLVGALYSLITQFGAPEGTTLAGMVLRDRTSLLLQVALVVICFVSVLISESYLRHKRINFTEFYPLALWATGGAMIMVSTTNLLMMFVGLEVLSVALYIMAGMSRYEEKSEESALKYFLLGAFASAFLVYGIAMVYGATGSLQLDQISVGLALKDDTTTKLLAVGVGLMLVAFCFKAAMVPFHQWTPDVYQGAPTNVTAFMAAGSKVAAIGALYRVLIASTDLSALWQPAMFWIAILTMTLPNLTALVQKDVKRVLGYSSISNAGYVLVALIASGVNPKVGPLSMIVYLLSYSLMTLGVFAIITLTARDGKEGTSFEDLNGLWKRHPFAAGLLIVFIASLVGIPITSGFFGKLLIFNDALASGLTPLAIVLAINSAISAYYYLKIVKAAVVSDTPDAQSKFANTGPEFNLACAMCAVGVVALAFLVGPISSFLQG